MDEIRSLLASYIVDAEKFYPQLATSDKTFLY